MPKDRWLVILGSQNTDINKAPTAIISVNKTDKSLFISPPLLYNISKKIWRKYNELLCPLKLPQRFLLRLHSHLATHPVF